MRWSQTRHRSYGSLAPDGRSFYRLPVSHDRQKRDHAALREICLLDGILLLVQEHALFKDYLFQVGLKEREICRLKRRQQTIMAAWRGVIVPAGVVHRAFRRLLPSFQIPSTHLNK